MKPESAQGRPASSLLGGETLECNFINFCVLVKTETTLESSQRVSLQMTLSAEIHFLL